MSLTNRELALVKAAYHRGYTDGLKCFAEWKDGEEYLGTSGTRLEDAIAVAETQWNYSPPINRNGG